MIDENWDAAVGVEAEIPVFLLLVGRNVAGEKVSRVNKNPNPNSRFKCKKEVGR